MFKSSQSKMRLFAGGCLCALLLLGCDRLGSLLVGGDDDTRLPDSQMQEQAPAQIIVFDGALDASSTYFIALSDRGFQVERFVSSFDEDEVCNPPDNGAGKLIGYHSPALFMRPGRIETVSPPRTGVWSASSPIVTCFTMFDFSHLAEMSTPAEPVDVDSLEDDCDALDQYSSVVAYLDAISQQAADLQQSLEDCISAAEQKWCEIVDFLNGVTVEENLTTFDSMCGPGGSYGSYLGGTSLAGFCRECQSALRSLSHRIDSLEYRVAACESELDYMGVFYDHLAQNYDGTETFPMTPSGWICFREQADDLLVGAQQPLEDVADILDTIQTLMEHCSLESVEASCEDCGGASGDSGYGDDDYSEVVMAVYELGPIPLIVSALREAAGEDSSSRSTAALGDLAERLSRVEADQVWYVVAPSRSSVEQCFVAVRAADNTIGQHKAQVVILNLLSTEEHDVTEMTSVDELYLFEQFKVFVDALRSN